MELDRQLWGGKIPCSFTLADEDCSSLSPQPFHIMIPRHGYLHLFVAEIIDHVQSAAPECDGQNIWFSTVVNQGGLKIQQPLKWHFPVGTLYDLFTQKSSPSLPWNLTVHTQQYPSDKEVLHRMVTQHHHHNITLLLQLLSLEADVSLAVRSMFMNTLKQAVFLKLGSKGLQALSQKQTAQLWNGVTSDKFDLFWQINQLLSPRDTGVALRHLPVRIVQRNAAVIQQPILPLDAKGQPWSLGSLLSFFLPNFFGGGKSNQNQPSSEAAGKPSTACTTKTTVWVQGVSPPLDTPVDELVRFFSHPDSFLYIVIT